MTPLCLIEANIKFIVKQKKSSKVTFIAYFKIRDPIINIIFV